MHILRDRVTRKVSMSIIKDAEMAFKVPVKQIVNESHWQLLVWMSNKPAIRSDQCYFFNQK